MKKFWNWIRNEDTGERILRLDGPVDEDNLWGDSVTPKIFRSELEAEDGDVTVWINSPGGNVFSAAQIYTMLCEYKGKITVKIDAIAASAASVIAMAGDRVLISPVGMIFVHDPMTMAMGNAKDMERAITTLNEVKASIINAYQRKTGLSRNKISQLMENETWMAAKKAVELGFADEVMYGKDEQDRQSDATAQNSEGEKPNGKEIKARAKGWQSYSTRAMGQRVLNWLLPAGEETAGSDEEPDETEGSAQAVAEPETGVTGMFEEALGEAQQVETDGEEPMTDGQKPIPDGEQSETVSPAGHEQPATADEQSTDVTPEHVETGGESANNAANNATQAAPDGPTGQEQPAPADLTGHEQSETDNLTGHEQSAPDGATGMGEATEAATLANNEPATAAADVPVSDTVPMQAEPGTQQSIPDEQQSAPAAQQVTPVIGMDGKTEDGAMPYELLKRQLEYLR